uniref:Calmodulin-binding transcription activator 5 isoform X3 n=2 Tax=Rhizophora mucronata TaxID=61149 RepID=A0A2P2LW52_RHIMU
MEIGVGKQQLVGSEIHGFHTLEELDVATIKEEAPTRWLRPNEIHAILCNNKCFPVKAKPVHLPKSGTLVLFDRRMLRNFRKDGHNWKKKKDGKTVKEAHEHLKVGNEERIHVYYAHGEDNATFVRRCYWLLDKALEHIVLVHYRETQELHGSPGTPVNSNSSSVSDQANSWHLSEEFNSGSVHPYYAEPGDSISIRNHEMRLHEINTLEWDELVTNDPSSLIAVKGDEISCFNQQNQTTSSGSVNDSSAFPTCNLSNKISSLDDLPESIVRSGNTHFNIQAGGYNQKTGIGLNLNVQGKDSSLLGTVDSLDTVNNDSLQSQDSFGRWMNSIMADSLGSVDNSMHESPISSGHESLSSPPIDQHQSSVPVQIFIITDVSPGWAFSTETTKILVTGYFLEKYQHLEKSNLFCICGDECVSAEIIQTGVYRCLVLPHSPGLVNVCLSLDGHKPISQVLNFEYRAHSLQDPMVSSVDESKWEEFQHQMRLAHLLFSTSKSLNILSMKVSPVKLKEAENFAHKTSHIFGSWAYLIKSIEDNRISFARAKDGLFELALKNIVREWLLERVVKGCKITEYDAYGQGVIHLCAILGYTWAVYMFSWSGLSLDFRDKHGWTALHWAAFCGREKMVAVLLSAGAKPNLVTDSTSQHPGGCTAADLASGKGYDGLAAYLSEKALVAQFQDMHVAGNVTGSLQTDATETVSSENLSQDELYIKDTLAAYRTAADAAARIQVAFREHSLKVQAKAVQISNPESEARNIIAAMKIQHAFRNFEGRKKMAAAARIQYRFRTWKMRREFLNMRHHVIRIQSAFRGFQVRRQYRKIVWSVGVLEKAILRWRLKRKGFRGLHVVSAEAVANNDQASDAEEDFYATSRHQAEERNMRAVVRVQAMFRSKKAQEEYHRMKLAHEQAKLEYEGLLDHGTDMET